MSAGEKIAGLEARVTGGEKNMDELWNAVTDLRKLLAKTRESVMIIQGIGIAINALLIFVGPKIFGP